MIYLTEGNTPLNEAYNDEIVHLGNNTYQLTFRFPTSDTKWELLKEETFLTADDLHGEQDFYIFEVEKQQGYIQVYANQVISLLNNYIVSSIEVDRVSGTRVLSAFAGSITRANPFSFFSDIDDRHTLNIKDKNAMEVLAKGKHSILGQWGGDMVRNGYNLRLLKNGGSENESLFMYKKNLSSYQHKTSTKSLKTRITFKTTVKGEGENAVDHDYMVVIDSPLLGNYSQIYEDVVEVNDQDVTDEASLIEYGKQYFRTSMCDMLEDNLEISVVGQSDVAVQMFDVVSFYHEWYGLDVRKKITKYTYSPMAKLLKSIGFGTFQSSLANAIGGIVNDAVLNESRNLHQIFEERLKKEIANADRAFDAEFSKREKTITDAIELAKAKAEEVKQELSDTINQRFNSFDNGPLKEAKRKAEEALRNAGASSSLAQESKRIGLDSVARLEAFKSQTTSAQTALSGDLDALKRTIVNDIRPKQAQVEAEIAKQVEALVQTKKELSGASTLLAQEAKRIELDSVARLEAFKSQTTSAQTALSGDLDVLKRTIANDIRPKQAQAEAEIAKQVEALSRTKNELSGASTLLAQEAKRIELDSVARLEAFKSQTTSAQTALSGDLDVLKRTIANDIRPKQAQAEAEIAKQVEVLSRTKNELAGVKSAQATYEETTTRRLSELTNLANGKASKSELTQTAEELASRIASVQAGSSRNYFRNSRSRTFTTGGQAVYDYRTFIVPDFWKNSDRFKRDYVRISFDVTFPVALVNDMPAMVHFSAHPWYAYRNLIFKGGTVERQHFEFTIDLSSSSEDYQTNNVFIRFGTNYGFPAGLQVVIENAMLSVGNYFPAYQPAYEDQEDRVSVVESNFKQRADSLEAGVSRLTEGLRTKADISSLNVTAENIRQSVKSLETDTQNKLNQKLSQAEFEVRAGSIRQEILNATKDKASKSELTQTAEELSSKIASVQASGRNLFLNSLFKQDISKTGIWTTSTYTAAIDSESKYLGHNALKIIGLNPSGRDGGNPKVTYPALGQFGKVIPGSTTNQDVTISFYAKANKNGIMLRSRLGNIGYKTGNVTLSTEIKRYVVHIPKGWTNESKQTTNEWLFNFNQEGTVWIWMPKFEISDVDTSYSEAPEDIEGQISTVESTFKQRANSLDAGVRSLTEGLRTKVDISALNVTAENIRQSVKSLETDTQNKLNQKLSQAEFEVRAGSIRQEILNATKDKASKSELTQTAEELASRIASVHLGRRNLLKGTKELARYKPVSEYNGFKVIRTVAGATRYQDSYVERTVIPTAGTEYIAIFYARASENDYPVRCHFYNPNTVVSSENSSGYKSRSSDGLSIIRLSTDWQLCWVKWTQTATDQAKTVIIGRHGPQVGGKEGVWVEICAPAIFEGNLAGDWSPAYEDQDERVSAVESNFKQRANSLDAGVRSLTEGLRTKVDISALNVTAENIRQSVKSLETDTQNKLNQKLSQAEFEVRAGSIRQEILNATKDKASKSELTQTAEELASRIASVKVGGRNYYRDSEKIRTSTRFFSFPLHPYLSQENVGETWTLSFDLKINEGGEIRPLLFYHYQTNRFGLKASADITPSKEWQRFTFTGPVIFPNDDPRYSRGEMALYDHGGNNNYSVRRIKLEKGTLATDWSPAIEDIEGQISTVESTFKQRANSLDAGVRSLTEGLRTKADISALNVTAENIRQSVKSLETDTQNKLNQKLSQAEFEVRAGSIRQEILNATKDKADKTLVTAEAGKLREELTSLSVGENLFVNSDFKNLRDNGQRYTANGKTYQNMIAPYWYNPYNAGIPNAQNIQHGYFDTETFSDTVFAFNESDGSRHWKALSTDFKIGVISAGEYYFSADLYATDLGTHIKFGFYYHNSTGKLNFYAGRTKIEVTEKGRWTRLGIDLKVNDDIDLTKKVQFYIYGYNFARNSILYLKKPKVSKGRLKSDWSPALEDTEGLITEAKATFERTAQGLRTDLSAIQEYVNKDGQRQEALQRYTREESARQATAVRELVNRDFVGKATYQEDVKGINQRIEAVKTSANKDIASQIASYRQSVDGKFTDISSQITTYKQDVGGQISGLSNRLTSSEQGTTTQISNLSNRINSNKQGTDNQISNLKTQVATNKDNAERQMGRISDQVSANKANADSQFANVTNQLARKVETTDFQRVKETSKLYERILGNTENGIADKVARMALTNQLFQVEVGKYSVSGPNLIKNSDFKNATNEWGSTQNLGRLVKHSFYHNGQKDLMRLSNATKNENFLYSHRFNLERNTDYVLNFRGFNNSALASYDVYILGRRAGESDGFTIVKKVVSSKKLSTSRCEDVSVTFNSGEMDNAYIRFDNNGSSSGTADLYITEVDLYKGYKPRTWQPHPEDAVADANKKLEATQTKMTQLAGSWAVQNINSAGDIISGINLGANGHNRFVGKLTHITGETLIDRAVIKSAMVDKLKTANFEAGSVTTTILDAEAVTADKVRFDAAFIRKMTANDAFIDQLTSKRIFSTKVESVISSSTFLEAYQGRIGGFTIGRFAQGRGRWISGINQFSVGMGNGEGGSYNGENTAFWANWGHSWNSPGPNAWYVTTSGNMYCRNGADFHGKVDFSNSSRANFYGNTTFSRSPVFSNGIELGSKDVLGDGWNPKGGRNAVVWWNQVGSGSVKYWMEQKSDRRLKENITDTAVKALDKINRLRMVAFDFIENKKHEEIGLIAQEAETIVPRIVSRDPENPDGYLHIDYTALVPYLIKAIQELNQKIEKMEKTIA
ncbi:phage tail spike protein [Streptococcus pneumoniae]|uniref:phage tail spike protein n=8 Tax=Streptococcus pneumoniae TaxID=1313 RepID=UPI0005DF57DB|nr:phage tail spike protein [Streptococcus pneumoniae]CJK95779.1 PblB [Streptococcus pneumoniae]CJU31582.1 PblB [Streptococcus pneumoniae]